MIAALNGSEEPRPHTSASGRHHANNHHQHHHDHQQHYDHRSQSRLDIDKILQSRYNIVSSGSAFAEIDSDVIVSTRKYF